MAQPLKHPQSESAVDELVSGGILCGVIMSYHSATGVWLQLQYASLSRRCLFYSRSACQPSAWNKHINLVRNMRSLVDVCVFCAVKYNEEQQWLKWFCEAGGLT